MRKEKIEHSRGADGRGRAGSHGRPRRDGRVGAKGKGAGGSTEKEEEIARCRNGGKLGGGLQELKRRKRFKRFLNE
jgi:hypothetical protein